MMVSITSARIPVHSRQISGICRRYHVRRLALFGSVLRNDFRPDSDVDVLVAFEPEVRVGFVTLSRMQRELSELFKRPVDLVPMDGLKPVIRESVLSSAQDVYAA
jgi:predicted nucleotidyltransferase